VQFDLAQTDALLTTTRSVRRRLDLTRPVGLDVIRECLTIALQAPTGSGFEDWRWVVVTDDILKRAIGDVYRATSMRYLQWWRDKDPTLDETSAAFTSAQLLWDHLADEPVIVFPCFQRRPCQSSNPNQDFVHASVYGSIFPAAWSFQLACRSRGMGTCLVTGHLNNANEIADIIGLPDDIGQAGLVAVGHITGDTNFRPAPHRPLDEVMHLNHWS
jgi:nitroreductase